MGKIYVIVYNIQTIINAITYYLSCPTKLYTSPDKSVNWSKPLQHHNKVDNNKFQSILSGVYNLGKGLL